MRALYTVLLTVFYLCLTSSPAAAEKLDVIAPGSGEQATVDLAYGEAGELTVYLKSYGDIVDGIELTVLDDQNQVVGKNTTDMYGIAKFTNLPPGHFRITLERKKNDRGGWSTANVGDLRIRKIRKQ